MFEFVFWFSFAIALAAAWRFGTQLDDHRIVIYLVDLPGTDQIFRSIDNYRYYKLLAYLRVFPNVPEKPTDFGTMTIKQGLNKVFE